MPRVSVRVPLEELQPKTVQPAEPSAPETVSEPQTDPPLKMAQSPAKSFNKNYLVYAAGILIVLILVLVLLNDRRHLKQEVNKLSTNTSTTNNAQSDALKYQDEIGKIAELPTGQTPSLIPVTDAPKLASENAFFQNAKNGDVVLLYVSPDKSVRAILYRPSNHKIVEATSSASVGGGASSTTPQTTTPTKITKP